MPDDERPVSTFCLPLLAMILWLLLILLRAWLTIEAGGLELASKPGFACVWRVLGLGSMPVMLCWAMLRAAAPQEQRWTGLCMSLSAFSVAALGAQLLCKLDERWFAQP